MSDPFDNIYKSQDLDTLDAYLKVIETIFNNIDGVVNDGLNSIKKKERDEIQNLINSLIHPETNIGEALDYIESAREAIRREISVVKDYIKESNKLASGKYLLSK